MPATVRKLRCAIYTRKSTEEGLDQAFNSLDAQRDACEAYIAEPARRGLDPGARPLRRWRLLRRHSRAASIAAAAGRYRGRPGRRHRRLQDGSAVSRSLTDFVKLVELFDQHDVTFVSVTQSFNTTTSPWAG